MTKVAILDDCQTVAMSTAALAWELIPALARRGLPKTA